MQVFELTITPDRAQEILESSNSMNRPLNMKHVRYLATEMRNGRWKNNGDTICFDKNHILLDGQHRLKALILAEVTLKFLVVQDLATETFATKDCGRSRGPADTLAIRGEKNYTTLASAVVWLDKYEYGRMTDTQTRYSPARVVDLVQYYGDELKESIVFTTNLKINRMMAPALVAALHVVFKMINSDQADEFFQRLFTGHGLDQGSPILALREKLIADRVSRKVKMHKYFIAALTIKAWNLFRQGRKSVFLRLSDKELTRAEFPVAR